MYYTNTLSPLHTLGWKVKKKFNTEIYISIFVSTQPPNGSPGYNFIYFLFWGELSHISAKIDWRKSSLRTYRLTLHIAARSVNPSQVRVHNFKCASLPWGGGVIQIWDCCKWKLILRDHPSMIYIFFKLVRTFLGIITVIVVCEQVNSNL